MDFELPDLNELPEEPDDEIDEGQTLALLQHRVESDLGPPRKLSIYPLADRIKGWKIYQKARTNGKHSDK
ncbi:hypothetical protein Nepgr_033465 [Nepenthes gracilis]|uniref:Uncharacterized protein n=1 Tax=Nepenthes gracilis TaxID=150966 RepID=A0AAD3Y8Z5_NEPGR|nr:hypothetical protein Nepgr_033465 [Nepenthes gracilis]